MATTKTNVWNTLFKSFAALGLTYLANKAVDPSVSWVDTRKQIVTAAVTSVATALADTETVNATETAGTTDTTTTAQ